MIVRSLIGQCRVFICVFTLTISSTASAITFSNVYIFGDSLSDTDARASNGLLWPEYLAPQLGIAYDSAANFAIAGSKSSDLAGQVSTYQSTSTMADPNALYVVWAGGNDILAFLNGAGAANNVISIVDSLSLFGASNFFIPNMPDLGLIPADGTGFLTAPSIEFNSTIESVFASSSNVAVADVFGLHHQVLADPAAFGLLNVTDACFTPPASLCSDPSTYFFLDSIHPTTVGHSIIADNFAVALATIPIPAAVWLFGSSLIGFIGITRRKKA